MVSFDIVKMMFDYRLLEDEVKDILREFGYWMRGCDDYDKLDELRERMGRTRYLMGVKEGEIITVLRELLSVEEIKVDDELKSARVTLKDSSGESIAVVNKDGFNFMEKSSLVSKLLSITSRARDLIFMAVFPESGLLVHIYAEVMMEKTLEEIRCLVEKQYDELEEGWIEELFISSLGNKIVASIICSLKDGPLSLNELWKKVGVDVEDLTHGLNLLKGHMLVREVDGRCELTERGQALLNYLEWLVKHA